MYSIHLSGTDHRSTQVQTIYLISYSTVLIYLVQTIDLLRYSTVIIYPEQTIDLLRYRTVLIYLVQTIDLLGYKPYIYPGTVQHSSTW